MRPWSPFEIRYGGRQGRSLRSLRKLLHEEQGATWTFNLGFLKARAARSLGKGMTEFDQMSKSDKAEAMALLIAESYMAAWEAKKARA